jgi:hypothetical protein
MLLLENIEPSTLQRLGAAEEARIGIKAARAIGNRMERAATTRTASVQKPSLDSSLFEQSWVMQTASDDMGRRTPGAWAKVYGNSMAGHGLRHGDRIEVDHDLVPSDGDIVLADVRGVGRALRKLSIIGGVHVLSGDQGVKPIVVEDTALLTYHGVVIGSTRR